jgi:hypothetical protein
MSDPILLVVKRGASRRYDALKQQTSQMQVEVIWDRRAKARRVAATAATPERRTSDRRTRKPFTWQAADFVVAVPARSSK